MYSNIRTIRVGTFNLMNFMLPNRPVYNGTLCYNNEDYRHKSEWVEFMLNEIDADIIGFQELFHREAMVRIIKNNPRYRKARIYMAEETGDQPSVALLSRYPVENIEVFTHFPEESIIDFNPKGRERVSLPFTTFTRPVLKADVRIPNYGLITVFVIHLKSKREIFYGGESQYNPVDLARAQSRSLMLRASESVAVRSLVANALEIPDRPVILCGDVNDTGNAVTSRIISGEVPQHRLSDNVKRRVWDLLLYHVKDIQARRSYQDFYYTHIHNGVYESLDHIMVSQELVTEYPRNTGRVGLVSVFNDHLVDQTFTSRGVDKCKSDHGVVVCSIELDLDRAAKYIRDNGDYYDSEDLWEHKDVMESLDEIPVQRQNGDDDDSEPAPVPMFNMQNSLDRWKNNHPSESKRSHERREWGNRTTRDGSVRVRKSSDNGSEYRRSEAADKSTDASKNVQNVSYNIEFNDENVKGRQPVSVEGIAIEAFDVTNHSTKEQINIQTIADDLEIKEEKSKTENDRVHSTVDKSVSDLSESLKSETVLDAVSQVKENESVRGRTRRRTTGRRPIGQMEEHSCTSSSQNARDNGKGSADAVQKDSDGTDAVKEYENASRKSEETNIIDNEADSSLTASISEMILDDDEDRTISDLLSLSNDDEKAEKKTRRRTRRTEKSDGLEDKGESSSASNRTASGRRRRESKSSVTQSDAETANRLTAKHETGEKTETADNKKGVKEAVKEEGVKEEAVKVRHLFRPVPLKTEASKTEKKSENASASSTGKRAGNRRKRNKEDEKP